MGGDLKTGKVGVDRTGTFDTAKERDGVMPENEIPA